VYTLLFYARAQLLRKPVVVAAIQRLEEAQGAAPKDGNSEAEVAASSGSSQHQDDGDDDANNGMCKPRDICEN